MDKNEQNEVIVMLEDVLEGSKRGIDILAYIRQCANLLITRMRKDFYDCSSKEREIATLGSNCLQLEGGNLKHIRKRKDGRWEYRRTIGGKSYQKISKDFEDIKKFRTEVNDIYKSLLKNQNTNVVSFVDAYKEYYKLYKQNKLADGTKEEYITAEKYFDKAFKKPFCRLTAADFQSFINDIAEEHPTTALKLYNKIRAVCRKAYLTGTIKTNIGEIIEKPDITSKVRRALSFDEQKKFLALLTTQSQDVKVFCLFCLITSARRDEAIKLESSHFDRQKMTLFINGTKTLNASRTIKITQKFADLLESIDFKFKHTADFYYRETKKIFKQMGANDLTLHCLRHTCATNMVYLKISSDYRKHIMGHSTILVTDKVYTHIDTNVTKDDIEKLYDGLYFTDF